MISISLVGTISMLNQGDSLLSAPSRSGCTWLTCNAALLCKSLRMHRASHPGTAGGELRTQPTPPLHTTSLVHTTTTQRGIWKGAETEKRRSGKEKGKKIHERGGCSWRLSCPRSVSIFHVIRTKLLVISPAEHLKCPSLSPTSGDDLHLEEVPIN